MIIVISAIVIFLIIGLWAIIDCKRQVEKVNVFRVVIGGNVIGEFENIGDAMDCCGEYLDNTGEMPNIIIVKQ